MNPPPQVPPLSPAHPEPPPIVEVETNSGVEEPPHPGQLVTAADARAAAWLRGLLRHGERAGGDAASRLALAHAPGGRRRNTD
jgi:hypothetical protein